MIIDLNVTDIVLQPEIHAAQINVDVVVGNVGLQDIIAGDGIEIDKTDPLKPIITSTGSSGGGHTIQSNGTDVEPRTKLNFKGKLSATDNPADGSTDIEVDLSGKANQGTSLVPDPENTGEYIISDVYISEYSNSSNESRSATNDINGDQIDLTYERKDALGSAAYVDATDFAPALTTDENYVTDAEKLAIETISAKMDLDGLNSDIDKIHFGTNTTTPTAQDLYWDAVEETLSLHLPDGGDYQLGKEMFEYYHNIDSVTMVAGDVVSLVPISGNRKGIKLTDPSDESLSRNVVGMVTVPSILPNEIGRVTILGNVHELNTDLFIEGESIYVSHLNKGKWSQTAPPAPFYNIKIGTIEVKHQTVGIVALSTITYPKLSDLSDVNGTPLNTTGQIPVWDETLEVFDFTSKVNDFIPKTQNQLTKEPTGFHEPSLVIVTGDSATRKITLSGTVSASYRGEVVPALVTGWVSDAHGTDITKKYFLYYNGTAFVWSETVWTFDAIIILEIQTISSATNPLRFNSELFLSFSVFTAVKIAGAPEPVA